MPPGTAFRPRTGTSLAGNPFTGIIGDRNGLDGRPMTSTAGAGYKSSTTRIEQDDDNIFDPLNQGKSRRQTDISNSTEKHISSEELETNLETQIHKLIEESATIFCSCCKAENPESENIKGLEKAKEAAKKERLLTKHRKKKPKSLKDQHPNLELTFAVWFNLAHAYRKNDMKDEAIDTFSFLVKKKLHPTSAIIRLRVNMGNLFFQGKEYSKALKMYRMALDRVPPTEKELGFKICRNVGNCMFKLGRFGDAIQSFETVMNSSPDHRTGFNLILCYFTLGDIGKMKIGFSKLIEINNEDFTGHKTLEYNETCGENIRFNDKLTENNVERKKKAEQFIFNSARLIAPALDNTSWITGYQWIYDQLASRNEQIAFQMKMELSLQHLYRKEIDDAINILKSFEKKEPWIKAMAATNLSFIYSIEGNQKNSILYADLALKNARYSARAFVNMGNCLYYRNEYEQAKELYLEAIGVHPNCVEALINLGLSAKCIGLCDEALHAFEKANSLLPSNPIILYQIAVIYEKQNRIKNALKSFNLLISHIPTDPYVLTRIGDLICKYKDESQGLQYYLESYRYYPVILDVISWLGIWFIKNEMYEKSLHFFSRAGQIEPQEIKWQLVINSCYRRMGDYSKALKLYKKLHIKYPNNEECKFCYHIHYSNIDRKYYSFICI